MIVSPRSTRLSLSTDAVAESLRPVIACRATGTGRGQDSSASGGPLNLALLYPTLFAPARRTPLANRLASFAATFAAAGAGATAALVLIAGR